MPLIFTTIQLHIKKTYTHRQNMSIRSTDVENHHRKSETLNDDNLFYCVLKIKFIWINKIEWLCRVPFMKFIYCHESGNNPELPKPNALFDSDWKSQFSNSIQISIWEDEEIKKKHTHSVTATTASKRSNNMRWYHYSTVYYFF